MLKIREKTKVVQEIYLTNDSRDALIEVADMIDDLIDNNDINTLLKSYIRQSTYEKLFENNEGNTYYVLQLIRNFLDELRDNANIDYEEDD